ncbi:MAG TPA: PQQ-binding-like beta-propeller repeat protein [Baekduia sp.]
MNNWSKQIIWGALASGALAVGVCVAVFGGYLIGHFTHTVHKTVTAQAVVPDAAISGTSWPAVGGDLAGTRYSTLDQITTGNAPNLKLALSMPIDLPKTTGSSGGEATPIVLNGVMFAESGLGTLGAYDVSTGKPIWQKTAQQLGNKIPAGTRGMAYGEGLLYIDQIGGTLQGVDAATGKVRWNSLVNTQHLTGYSAQSAIYSNGLVFVGQSGSDLVGGARGFIKAFDAKTGKLRWTFNATPDPGTPDAKTWGDTPEAQAAMARGGGNTWTNVAVDPKLQMVYVPTGNTWPDFGRTAGDEYYTDGVLGLDLQTGKKRWFFQAVHHDEWDYDCAQPPVLWDQPINGKPVAGLTIACKSGYQYQLDRRTGKPVTPVREEPLANAESDPQAKKYSEDSLDWFRTGGKPMTEPIPVGAGAVVPHCAIKANLPAKAPDGKPYEYSCAFNYYSDDHFIAGTTEQALNWQPTSYAANLGYEYFCANNGTRAVRVSDVKAQQKTDVEVWPQLYQNGVGGSEPKTGYFTAIDVRTNKLVWQKHYANTACSGGSAVTAGGVVFTADSAGHFFGYDAKTGKQVWSFNLPGLSISAPPIVYEANGVEYVGVMATRNLQGVFMAWALGDKAPRTVDVSKEQQAGTTNGQALFVGNCASCHSLADAQARGTAGPNLDVVKPNAELVKAMASSGGRGMPSFGGVLSTKQIAALAKYVSSVAGTGPGMKKQQ